MRSKMRLWILILASFEAIKGSEVSVLLDLSRESECNHAESHLDSEGARQKAEAVQWALSRLQQNEVTVLESKIEDTCGNASLATSKVLSLASGYNHLISNAGCTHGYILVSSNLQILKPLAQVVRLEWLFKPQKEELLEEKAAALAMARRLKWSHVALLSNDFELMKAFGKSAERGEICVAAAISINTDRQNDVSNSSSLPKIAEQLLASGSKNVIAFVESYSIADLINAPALSGFTWILSVPHSTNTQIDIVTSGTTSVVYSMENNFKRAPEFTDFYRNLSSHSSKSYEDPALFQLMRSLTGLHKLAASKNGGCLFSLPSESEAREMLKLTYEERKISPFLMTAESQHLLIGEFEANLGLVLNTEFGASYILPGQSDSNCHKCKCLNLEVVKADQGIKWKYDHWVTIVATVSSLGLMASASFLFYIMGKSCSELLEGSQYTSLVLLLAIMLSYISIIPFGFEPTDLICPLRSQATRLAFVLLFSVILSRSLMLATSDVDGLPGHLSGAIQFSLLVFMAGIQVALVLQEWFTPLKSSHVTLLNGYQERLECTNLSNPGFLRENSYAMLLLGLQIMVSPFIISSKRNYKEGLLFCCGSFASLFIWIGWSTAFALVDDDNRDITVCCALVALPTALILIIYIPKCYLISSSGSLYYKGQASELNLQGFMGPLHTSQDTSASTSSRIGYNDVSSHALNTVTSSLASHERHNSLAAIGSIRQIHQPSDLYDTLIAKSQNGSNFHPGGRTEANPLRSHNFGGGHSFLASSLPCDSPERRAASEYPTFKLDQNTEVDTSISWERYPSYGLSKNTSTKHGAKKMQQLV